MTHILTLASLLSLALASAAHAGAYSDRSHQVQQSDEQRDAQEREQSQWRAQLELQKRVYAFAGQHGGMRDAGECTPYAATTCGLGFCVPLVNANVTVAQLSAEKKDRTIVRCEVAFGDGNACELTTEISGWMVHPSNRIPRLMVTCLDSHNVRHQSFQY